MITVFNYELSDEVINSLNTLFKKDISPQSAFHLLKLNKVLEKIISDKNEIYSKILNKYGEQDLENPNAFTVSPENMDSFQKESIEFRNIKHEFELDKINVDDLKLNDSIKVIDLYNLQFIFNMEVPDIKTSGDENLQETYTESEELTGSK